MGMPVGPYLTLVGEAVTNKEYKNILWEVTDKFEETLAFPGEEVRYALLPNRSDLGRRFDKWSDSGCNSVNESIVTDELKLFAQRFVVEIQYISHRIGYDNVKVLWGFVTDYS